MSIDSFAGFTFTDGVAFPFNAAINATGPATQDGTEFVKLMVDNYMFGPMQAVLDHANLTPDGVTEAAGTSQFVEALQLGFGAPPGVVTEWNLALDPATTGHRALLMQGQGILHANFVELTNAVYVGDGNNGAVAAGGGAYFKSTTADGLNPNIAGTFLILPESRGVVARGIDVAAAIDPDGASRFLGDLQVDAFQGHTFGDGGIAMGTADVLGGGALEAIRINAVTKLTIITDGVNGTPRTDSETRMYNRSTQHVIWY